MCAPLYDFSLFDSLGKGKVRRLREEWQRSWIRGLKAVGAGRPLRRAETPPFPGTAHRGIATVTPNKCAMRTISDCRILRSVLASANKRRTAIVGRELGLLSVIT